MNALLAVTLVGFLLGGSMTAIGIMVNTRSKLVFIGSALLGFSFWCALAFWLWVMIL